MKAVLKNLLRSEFGLTGKQMNSIHILRRECDLITGWSFIKGYVTDDVVGNIINGKTI
jgi:hypothetical protein